MPEKVLSMVVFDIEGNSSVNENLGDEENLPGIILRIVLSIVNILGHVFSSLYKLTLAVDSFDFCTPKRQLENWNTSFSFESISGKTLHSAGCFGLLQPYMNTFCLRE